MMEQYILRDLTYAEQAIAPGEIMFLIAMARTNRALPIKRLKRAKQMHPGYFESPDINGPWRNAEEAKKWKTSMKQA
jgi:hypothetical protein